MNEIIKELITPNGKVTVINENGKRIPFMLRKNLFDCSYDYEDATGKIVALNTDTNFDLVIKTSDLTKGEIYRIALQGTKLEFGDSDERTECVSGCSNGYCVALGAYLPNDEEKVEQYEAHLEKINSADEASIQEPFEYNTKDFTEYDVEMLADCSGFVFYLIDDTIPEIKFKVAWIKSDGSNDLEYESAVQFWTT